MYCLQACVHTFQPGNFIGWGSEGVKVWSRSEYISVHASPATQNSDLISAFLVHSISYFPLALYQIKKCVSWTMNPIFFCSLMHFILPWYDLHGWPSTKGQITPSSVETGFLSPHTTLYSVHHEQKKNDISHQTFWWSTSTNQSRTC